MPNDDYLVRPDPSDPRLTERVEGIAGEPHGVDESARHALAELVRTEARPAGATKGRIELADLELAERLDVCDIGYVECQQAGMRSAAARCFLARILRLVFLIDGEGDPPAA